MTEERIELSAAQIAYRYDVTVKTVWNWREAGLLPKGRRKGLRGDLRIPLDELLKAEANDSRLKPARPDYIGQ